MAEGRAGVGDLAQLAVVLNANAFFGGVIKSPLDEVGGSGMFLRCDAVGQQAPDVLQVGSQQPELVFEVHHSVCEG